jgi:multiple sugar transport system permease protein
MVESVRQVRGWSFLLCLLTFTAVFFKVIIGFVIAHFVHTFPTKGQRKWRGMLLVTRVIPPAMRMRF